MGFRLVEYEVRDNALYMYEELSTQHTQRLNRQRGEVGTKAVDPEPRHKRREEARRSRGSTRG